MPSAQHTSYPNDAAGTHAFARPPGSSMSDHANSADEANRARPMTPPQRRSRATTLLARAALGVLGLVLVAFFSHPLWLGPALGRYLSSASGRDVRFDSIRIGLSSSLAPVAHLRGVRIANAPWAESKEPFAELGDAVFVFDWLPFEGRHVVRYLLMRDGAVRLETACRRPAQLAPRRPGRSRPGPLLVLFDRSARRVARPHQPRQRAALRRGG